MFDFNIDKKTLLIILAVLALLTLVRFSQERLLTTIVALPAVIVAISFHEFSHAWMAVKLGDETPRNQGRLTVNPTKHLDPVGFTLLLLAGFGWGKPVQINPQNFDRKYAVNKGEILVALAGPIMNFIIAIVSAIIWMIIYKLNAVFLISGVGKAISMLLQSMVIINIGLGVFNLIPLPPLDGSKVLINCLDYNRRRWFVEREQIFQLVFMLMWVTGISGIIISPVIQVVYEGVMNGAIWLVGLFF